jgi:hypothetical protein
MTRSVIRFIGIMLLGAAIAVAVLNLHRVADLKMPWLAPLLMIWGAVFVILARRRKA